LSNQGENLSALKPADQRFAFAVDGSEELDLPLSYH
jgi:hypothetical protein